MSSIWLNKTLQSRVGPLAQQESTQFKCLRLTNTKKDKYDTLFKSNFLKATAYLFVVYWGSASGCAHDLPLALCSRIPLCRVQGDYKWYNLQHLKWQGLSGVIPEHRFWMKPCILLGMLPQNENCRGRKFSMKERGSSSLYLDESQTGGKYFLLRRIPNHCSRNHSW